MTEKEEFEFRARMEAERNPAPAKKAAPAKNQPDRTFLGDVGQNIGNLAAGALRGAGSIGATMMYPIDKATDAIKGDRGPTVEGLISGKQPMSRNEERRAAMDSSLSDMGAETDSMLYKGGKIGAEVAGTMGVGGALANGARFVAPALAATATGGKMLNAIASAGFKTGAPAATTRAGMVVDLGIRSAGGAANGAASAGLVNPQDAKLGAVIGGALPGAAKLVGAGAQLVGSGLRGSGVTDEVIRLANRAKELGISIPADRIANSKPLNALVSALDYVPFSGRAGTIDKMESGLNRALSRTFGQNSDNVTGALRKAQSELGAEFDRVLQTNVVRVDQRLLDDLANAEQRAAAELETGQASIIKNQIDEIRNKAAATGSIDGQAAYNIKRTLDRIGKRNSPEAFYASDLKRDLMEALNRSMTPEAAAAFATTRKQYGNMLATEKIALNGAEGNISVARLANMKNIGNDDLQELADISAQFVKSREGQHGAMQRAVVGLSGATAAFNGVVPGGGLLAGVAAGRATNMALNSNSLRNVITGQQSQNRLIQTLVDPRTRQLGYRAAPVVAD